MCNTKVCSRCKTEKPVTQFNKESRSKDGFNVACKECLQEYYRNYYSKNKKKWKEYESRPEVVEQSSCRRKKRYEEKKEEILEKNSDYYFKNKKKIRVVRRIWESLNKTKIKAWRGKRRKRAREATPSWLTLEDKQAIHDIYLLCAEMTVSENVKYEVDHIVPLSGDTVCGLHVPWNLQILEQYANRSKGNKLIEMEN